MPRALRSFLTAIITVLVVILAGLMFSVGPAQKGLFALICLVLVIGAVRMYRDELTA